MASAASLALPCLRLAVVRGVQLWLPQVLKAILEEGTNNNAVKYMHTREQTYNVIDYHKYERAMDAATSTDNAV